ncbi:MAG: sigma-70 family RNA polymerase sigma factor [Anderseniella sp.]|nr:sigma-70 family RNA polymerase sigma factor [Anderseniella sp.]
MTWSLARPLWDMAGYAETAGVQRAAGDISPAADAVLLARASEGDEQAFAGLVDRHYGFVFRVAARVLSEAADAEDVTQEAFVRLWRDPGAIDNPAALKGWLARMARNLAIDRIRRAKPSTADGLDEVPDGATAPDGPMRHAQAAGMVAAALAQLPERQRTALQLTYFEGFGNQQTAEVMQVSVEAVESLLSRARRTLREILSPAWGDLIEELDQLK